MQKHTLILEEVLFYQLSYYVAHFCFQFLSADSSDLSLGPTAFRNTLSNVIQTIQKGSTVLLG